MDAEYCFGFVIRIRNPRAELGDRARDIAKYLGVSRATLYRYLAEVEAA